MKKETICAAHNFPCHSEAKPELYRMTSLYVISCRVQTCSDQVEGCRQTGMALEHLACCKDESNDHMG